MGEFMKKASIPDPKLAAPNSRATQSFLDKKTWPESDVGDCENRVRICSRDNNNSTSETARKEA